MKKYALKVIFLLIFRFKYITFSVIGYLHNSILRFENLGFNHSFKAFSDTDNMTNPGSVAEQLNLFDSVSLDPTARLKEAMRIAERNAKQNQNLSRDQIVDRMGELEKSEGMVSNGRSGVTTKEQLEKWLSQDAKYIIPAKLLPIFCKAVKSTAPLQALAGALGAVVINAEENRLLEWAKLEHARRDMKKKQKLIEGQIRL